MRITLTTLFLAATIACLGQGYKDTRLIAKDTLKLMSGGKFEVSDTIVPITRASYVEFSVDGTTWAKDYTGTVQDTGYVRVSNDARQSWNQFKIYNLNNVLWTKTADTIVTNQDVKVLGDIKADAYFKGADTLKVTDLSASDGTEAYFLSVVGGKATWVSIPSGSGVYSAINVGNGGVPIIIPSADTTIFKFKSIGVSDSSVLVLNDVTNKRVNLKLNPSFLSLTPSAGLGGGGTFDATGNVGVNLSLPSLSEKNFDTNSYFVFYDPSTATHYKTKIGSDNYGYWRFNVNDGSAYTVNSHDTLKVYGEDGVIASRVDNKLYLSVDTTVVALKNNSVSSQYGFLYNGYTVLDSAKISSSDDWIVPTYNILDSLNIFLGGESVAGGKLKSKNLLYWQSPNTGATNSVGFSLLGSGERVPNIGDSHLGYYSFIWGGDILAESPTQLPVSKASWSNSTHELFGNVLGFGYAIRLCNPNTLLAEGASGTYVGNNGVSYSTIVVNGVEWITSNLRETFFRDYSSIANVQDIATWDTLSTSAYCVYTQPSPNRFESIENAITAIQSEPLYTTIACSDETTDLSVTSGVRTFRMPVHATLTAVRANVNTAPAGSTIIVDIKEAGVSVLGTKLSIDANEKTSVTAASQATITDSDIADDGEVTIDITQVGSSTAGKGLKLIIYYIKQ